MHFNRVTLLGIADRVKFKDQRIQLTIRCAGTFFKKGGEAQQITDAVPCVLWGKAAGEIGASITDGQLVIAEGKVKNRSYEKDGQKVWVTEVELTSLGPVGAVKEGPEKTPAPPRPEISDDDIPF